MARPKRTAVLVGAILIAVETSCYAEKAPLARSRPAGRICPVLTASSTVAVAYEDRLVQLQSDYKAKGAPLIAVIVNTMAADRLDKMKQPAEKKGFSFPYLYDEPQQIGRDYGATCTPHVFALDRDRKIAWMGPSTDG